MNCPVTVEEYWCVLTMVLWCCHRWVCWSREKGSIQPRDPTGAPIRLLEACSILQSCQRWLGNVATRSLPGVRWQLSASWPSYSSACRWVARFVTLDNRSMKIFEDSSRSKTKTNIPLHHVNRTGCCAGPLNAAAAVILGQGTR